MKIDEAKEREALVAWLRSEVDRLGGDWVPSPQQVWLARAAQPVTVTQEELKANLHDYKLGFLDVTEFARALGIEVRDE